MWFAQMLGMLAHKRRFNLVNVGIVTASAILVSLALPKHFRSAATILPPDSETPLNSLMGLSVGHIAQAVTNSRTNLSIELQYSPKGHKHPPLE